MLNDYFHFIDLTLVLNGKHTYLFQFTSLLKISSGIL